MLTRADAEELARSVPAGPYAAGGWRLGHGSETFDVIDPVTERGLATVVEADDEAGAWERFKAKWGIVKSEHVPAISEVIDPPEGGATGEG